MIKFLKGMKNVIIIHAEIKVKPDVRKEFLNQAAQLVEASQSEPGNISYRLMEEASAPNTFMMIEAWKDEEAVRAHNQAEHFKAFGNAAAEMLEAPLNVKRYSAEQL